MTHLTNSQLPIALLSTMIMVAPMEAALAQDRPTTAVPYCDELKELNNYAMSQGRFSPILGKPREGSYRETKLALTGWNNCAFYGNTTYTCDSAELASRDEAAKAQVRTAQEILACFAGTWEEAPEQMGPDFIVLHPKLGSASITLNLNETGNRMYNVNLILFLRR
jgi:hypothetical protein